MPKQPVNLRLDTDLVAAADSLAAATGTDRTELIARGLRRELLYEGGREFIYVLLDETGEVRYVGRSRDPFVRLREHIAAAKAGGKSAREAWLAQLLAGGGVPRLAIIDDAIPEDIASVEANWIAHFAHGRRLTNSAQAGVAPGERGRTKQRSIRFPDDLHAAIEAEVVRRGPPHSFSSVVVDWTRRGFDILGVPVQALEAALSATGNGQAASPPAEALPSDAAAGSRAAAVPAAASPRAPVVAARRDVGPKRAVAPIPKKAAKR